MTRQPATSGGRLVRLVVFAGCRWRVQVVVPDIEKAIKTCPIVFEGDVSAQLEQLLCGKFSSQAGTYRNPIRNRPAQRPTGFEIHFLILPID